MITSTTSDRRHAHRVTSGVRHLRVLADIVDVKLTGAETNGAYSLVETCTPPQGGAAMLHTHPPQETFIILEGNYEFKGTGPDGPYTIHAGAGDLVHIAAGAPHSYQNVGDTPARSLLLFEPPGRMIEFFEELHEAVANADPVSAPPEDLPGLERTFAIFEQYDVVVLPPDAG
ncbi:MAG TPA: cupin domain-containing protein [Thermomicrobiales bacterium]|nr:cupin domain-containing protein [Thermomicrobiales bacterium]